MILGTGILTWMPGERRSDRYGYVYLLRYGNSESDTWENIPIKHISVQRGKLVAKIVETRTSSHIGDLFHCVFPRTPDVGQEIVLGTGTLVFNDFEDEGGDGTEVGLYPDDDRSTMWLDMRALYDCHEQTVELRFEPAGVK